MGSVPTTDSLHRPGRTVALGAALVALVLLAACTRPPTGVSDRSTTTLGAQDTTSTTSTSTTSMSTTTTTAPGGTSSGALVLRDVGDGRSATVPVQDGGSMVQ